MRRYREQPNNRGSPCPTTRNNRTSLVVMIVSGSRARARQPRRSSRRNGNPQSHPLRTPCHRPSDPRGSRAFSRSCRRHLSATRKLRHQSIPSPGPRVISRGRTMRATNLGELRVDDPPSRRGLRGRRRRDRAHLPAIVTSRFVS